jgi:penicillin-binding protein 1A
VLNSQNATYPPPRRRPGSVVKKEFRKRLHGKPTHASNMITLPHFIGRTIGRVLQIVLIVVIILGFLVGGLGGGMLVGYVTTANSVTAVQLQSRNETTRIVDADGNEVAILTGSQNINREFIPISDVKGTYIDEAFMAIEDERFKDHIGIDPKRIGSAILSALTNGGSPTHGGSTITQQTVKLVSGADDISAQRKIQEWYNAIRLEPNQQPRHTLIKMHPHFLWSSVRSWRVSQIDQPPTTL